MRERDIAIGNTFSSNTTEALMNYASETYFLLLITWLRSYEMKKIG